MLPASHGSQCLQRRQAVSTVNPSPWLFIIIIIISASSLFLGVIYHRQVDLGRCLYVLILREGRVLKTPTVCMTRSKSGGTSWCIASATITSFDNVQNGTGARCDITK